MAGADKIGSVWGAVLSGGLSVRMGMPKDRIALPDGRLIISHITDIMLAVCNEVVIAGPENPNLIKDSGRIHFVRDNYSGQGPLAGIEAVLSTGLARGYIIAACDQPFLNEDILRAVVPEDRNRPCFYAAGKSGYIQPFPGYYPVSWLPDIRDALRRNTRAIRSLISGADVLLCQIDSATEKRLQSINTKAELAELSGEDYSYLTQRTENPPS